MGEGICEMRGGKIRGEEILKMGKGEDVGLIGLELRDIVGRMKKVEIGVSELEKGVDKKMMLDG